jgi:hypothetical protein
MTLISEHARAAGYPIGRGAACEQKIAPTAAPTGVLRPRGACDDERQERLQRATWSSRLPLGLREWG